MTMREEYEKWAIEFGLHTAEAAFAAGAAWAARECVSTIKGGSFLHENAPDARMAREVAKAIKARFPEAWK